MVKKIFLEIFSEKRKKEILMSAFRVLVKNPVKESLYGKRKKINVLTVFFISHKCDVKTFLKLIINKCPKGTNFSYKNDVKTFIK